MTRIVLIHGFAQTGACWGPLPARLRALGYDIATPDVAGFEALMQLMIKFAVAVSLVLVATAGSAKAGAGDVEIERMTWIEVRDRVAAGMTTMIIPTGSGKFEYSDRSTPEPGIKVVRHSSTNPNLTSNCLSVGFWKMTRRFRWLRAKR